jgi:diguanylate cyclase (GGDEF)-like protein/PAS domain S-box-containing protein
MSDERVRDATADDSSLPSLFGEIIGHAPIGVAVIDYDGRYRSVNPAYCQMYGYAEGDLLGRSFTMVVPAAERETILARHQAFLAQGGPLKGEFTVIRHDGEALYVVAESVKIPGDNGRGLRLAYVVDVTPYKQLERSLRSAADTYRTLFETVPQGIVYFDLAGNILTANPAALRILEVDFDELVGKSSHTWPWKFTDADAKPISTVNLPSNVAIRTGERVRGVVMGFETRRRGRTWIEVSAVPLFKEGRLDQVYSCFEDITERVILGRELEQKATKDFLTGVANRASAIDRLVTEFEHKRRHADQRCAVLLLDLDYFKNVNDTMGHAAGDAVLRHVSSLLTDAVRTTDLVARMGGEEFLLLLRGTGLASALTLAQRMCERVAARCTDFEGTAITTTISIGASVMRTEDTSVDDVLARADQALYSAKNAGRNRVCAHADPLASD